MVLRFVGTSYGNGSERTEAEIFSVSRVVVTASVSTERVVGCFLVSS